MKIQELRIEMGFSQRELAQKLKVSPGNLCDWEKGRTQPDVTKLIEIADALDVSIDELVGREIKINLSENMLNKNTPPFYRLTNVELRLINAYKKLSPSKQENLLKFLEAVANDD